MISNPALQEIQDRLNIVEVVGGYLSLKKAGRNFKGLCPFHSEKTPSFMIYPEKQFFICYGCGAAGDLISFVMKHEKLEFPADWKTYGKKAGHIRNQQMLDQNPDLVVAFHPDTGITPGTRDMVTRANAKGTPVKIFTYPAEPTR